MLAPQAGDTGSNPVRATHDDRQPTTDNLQLTTKWWNLVDTRRSERRAFAAWEFDSPLGHLQAGRRPTGPHKAGPPGSIPGPATVRLPPPSDGRMTQVGWMEVFSVQFSVVEAPTWVTESPRQPPIPNPQSLIPNP